MVRLTGAALGFLAFAIAIILGLTAGNTVETTLIRAIQAMFIFFALGLVVGWIAYRVIDEHSLREHRELFPDGELASIPSSQETGDEGAPKMVS
ncbi:MAG TPA: hypothetical protein PL151_01590 [Phycisphaerae bacterium]|nr:hypothetical protein [Phycisphaerae bacterium]HOJ74314.1 hypothetical protein [Phycisphaerae bacterium]HOM51393.1 hypothetical protein [Phycisphaerae bacterium]HON67029.1 hypothetical protein [Phycisphaerae bacterium]HOQ85626.1 hypothetical protein [Phycisphaerae bacterium]